MESINLGHTIITRNEENIFLIAGSEITYQVNHLKEIQEAVFKLNSGKPALLLIVAKEFTSIDADTRKFITSKEGNTHALAKAFIAKSLAQKILLNFIVKAKNKNTPTRFFKDTKRAEDWLKKMESNSIPFN